MKLPMEVERQIAEGRARNMVPAKIELNFYAFKEFIKDLPFPLTDPEAIEEGPILFCGIPLIKQFGNTEAIKVLFTLKSEGRPNEQRP